jgi:hypothetical protein
MSIIARCEGCQKSYKVADQLAGKRMRCKACGHVVTVPAVAPPPLPVEDDDLIPLAPTVAESAPRPATRVRIPPPLPQSGGPPVPPPLRGRHQPVPAGAPVPALAYGSADTAESAYVTLANEAVLDRFLPFLMVGLFVAFVVALACQGVARTLEVGQEVHASDEAVSRGVGYVIGFAIGYVAGVAAIAAPLCLLGVYVASRVMKFPNRARLYWRCLAAVCGPTALTGFVALALGATTQAAEVVSWVLLVPLLFVVLWLLLRLRPAPFAVTAGFVLLFAVLLPTAFYYAVFGFPQMGANANATTAARTTPPPPQPSAPAVLPPGSRERKYSIAKPGEEVVNAETERRRPLTIQEKSKLQRAEAQMRRIAAAIPDYATGHKGMYPDSLAQLVNAGLLTAEEVREDGSHHYLYAGTGYMKYPAPAKLIIVERDGADYPRHTVVFGDGRVESIEPVRWEKVREESWEAHRALMAQRSAERR